MTIRPNLLIAPIVLVLAAVLFGAGLMSMGDDSMGNDDGLSAVLVQQADSESLPGSGGDGVAGSTAVSNDDDANSDSTRAGRLEDPGQSPDLGESPDSDSEAPSVSTPKVPVFNSFSVSEVDPCQASGPQEFQTVTVSWDIHGADSIYLAIDNEYGPYESGLPAAGELEVPGPGCVEPNIYYVVAENSIGRTVRQATRTPIPLEDPPQTEPTPPEPPQIVVPVFKSFAVSPVEACPSPSGPAPGPVTVSWSIEGADTIYLAIDNEFGAYESGLAASGQLSAPGPGCSDDNVYYLVAENSAGRVVMQQTRTGVLS